MSKPDPRRDRDQVRAHLDTQIVRANSDLVDYQRHVRRWMDCAPDGAVFLVAPLMGWDGTPFRARQAQGPWGRYAKRLRAARVALGLHPLGGRFGPDGNPQPPTQAYTSPAARACMGESGSC